MPVDNSKAMAASEISEPRETAQQQLLPPNPPSKAAIARDLKKRVKAAIELKHIDIIKDDFWVDRPWILSGRTS